MSRRPRKLTLKARAERQEETRRRITEAAVALHESVGPAYTSVSAIARKAGVQRLTFYRHFPDVGSLFQACSAHYLATHPLPDPSDWLATADPEERLNRALTILYQYYRGTAAMNQNLFRDAAVMPELAKLMDGYRGFIAMMADLLAEGLRPSASHRLLKAALAHALDFETWLSLTSKSGLSDEEAVRLMSGMVKCAR